MANLNFYALRDDLRELIKYLLSETDIAIFELASEYDRELRQFRSLAELESAFERGNQRSVNLQLWSSSVMVKPVVERIELKGVPGHTFRYTVRGAGIMQLYLNGIQDGLIHYSHFGHWNEAGARQRSIYPAEDCDWRALAKLSGRIQRHIRNQLASAKFGAMPILHHALNALEKGQGLWCSGVHYADSEHIQRSPVSKDDASARL